MSFFLITDLNLLTAALTRQICNPTAELVVFTGVPKTKTKAEI